MNVCPLRDKVCADVIKLWIIQVSPECNSMNQGTEREGDHT